MKLHPFLSVIVALAGMLACSHAETRMFIDQSGRSLEGEFVKVDGGMVTIKRASDGQVFTVAVTTFSKADQAYIAGKGGGSPAPTAAAAPAAATPPKGESLFSVDLVSPSREYLHVDGAWQSAAECIQAKLSTTADVSGSDATIMAYFFSADGKLVDTVNRPSSQADNLGDGGTVKPIALFQKGKKYQVFFGISDRIKSGTGKWKRVIVVFGQKDDFDAKIYPKDDIRKFDFPEKMSVSASRLSQ